MKTINFEKKETLSELLQLKVTESVKEQLRKKARFHGLSEAEYVRRIIEYYFRTSGV
jgi:hypothetical protein